ncbi:MAG: CBU_0592 family membrane protein [Caulobacteraceae bacterium]
MSLPDLAGLAGVLLILAAYAGAQVRRLDPLRPPALLMNLAGALLILVSLAFDWNLSAAVMEGAWALVALYGLARWAQGRSGTP